MARLVRTGKVNAGDRANSLHFPCERATVFLRRQVLCTIPGCDKSGAHLVFDARRAVLRPSVAMAVAEGVRPDSGLRVQVWTRVQGGFSITYDVVGGDVFQGRLKLRVPARTAQRVSRDEVMACPQ